MSFDMVFFTVLDYLSTAIYLHFRSIYVQINALTKKKKEKKPLHKQYAQIPWIFCVTWAS